jgi:uncharacterized integral membrane protein
MDSPTTPPIQKDPARDPVQPAAGAGPDAAVGRVAETRGARAARNAHRAWLYILSFMTLAVFVFLVALVASNSGHVKASWVFGTSRVSLVWLVLFSAILGWVLGLLLGALLHWRTRRPRDSQHSPVSASGDDAGRR